MIQMVLNLHSQAEALAAIDEACANLRHTHGKSHGEIIAQVRILQANTARLILANLESDEAAEAIRSLDAAAEKFPSMLVLRAKFVLEHRLKT